LGRIVHFVQADDRFLVDLAVVDLKPVIVDPVPTTRTYLILNWLFDETKQNVRNNTVMV
jgi:hypothetical protein